jgi:hypothetical protein
VYWRTIWNITHKFFWHFLSPRRFASRLGYGHATEWPAFQASVRVGFG